MRSLAAAFLPLQVATTQGIMQRGNVGIEPKGHRIWEVTTPYAPANITQQTGGPNLQPGQWTFSFDTTGGQRHITNSGQVKGGSTIASYKAAGFGGAIPDTKGTIGFNAADNRIDGVDVASPALKFQVTFCHPQGAITMPRVRTLAKSTACVNSDAFFDFQPGECLFLGANGTDGSQADCNIVYHFDASENVANLQVGDIVVVAKNGWDYLWVSHKLAVDSDRAISPPLFAYVERVYQRIAFQPLFGFGGQ